MTHNTGKTKVKSIRSRNWEPFIDKVDLAIDIIPTHLVDIGPIFQNADRQSYAFNSGQACIVRLRANNIVAYARIFQLNLYRTYDEATDEIK
jgi:hypothetical protein